MTTNLFQKLFRVFPGEGRKVLAFALLAGILQSGTTLGMTAGDALFLSHVGAAQLPILYLITPLVMIGYILLSTFFLSRVGTIAVLRGALIVATVVSATLGYSLSVLTLDPVLHTTLIYSAKLFSVLAYIALYTLFWNYVDSFFHIQDAKRLYALFAGSAAVGATIAGLGIPLALEHLKVSEIFFGWSLLSILALPTLRILNTRFRALDLEGNEPERESTFALWRSMVRNLIRSSFARNLTTLLFALMFATLVCEYQYLAIFAENRSESELAALLGGLFATASALNVFITVFLFPRLVVWLGAPNVALIQPTAYILSFALLLVDPTPFAATVGFFAFHGLLTSIDYNNSNILLNALPANRRRQLRTLIEGLCEPLATALAGGVLFVSIEQISLAYISAIGLLGALICLGLAFRVRSAYLPAVIENLRSSSVTIDATGAEVRLKLPEGVTAQALFLWAVRNGATLTPDESLRMRIIVETNHTIRPALAVQAIRDRTLPYAGRLLAVKLLKNRSFGTLTYISDGVVLDEIQRCEALLKNGTQVTSKDSSSLLARRVLMHARREMLADGIQFIIALLHYTGRLPHHRTLWTHLTGENLKSRGTAYEVLEHALPRSTRLRVTHLLQGLRKRGGKEPEERSLRELLTELIPSTAQTLTQAGILLDPTPSRITLAARLLNNSLFAALETPTLLRLSTDGDLQIIDSGSQLLLDRESIGISVTEGRDSPSASDIVNRAGLTGKNADTEAVIDGPAEVLVLPAALVRKEIERSPALAQALLQQLGGDDVAA